MGPGILGGKDCNGLTGFHRDRSKGETHEGRKGGILWGGVDLFEKVEIDSVKVARYGQSSSQSAPGCILT